MTAVEFEVNLRSRLWLDGFGQVTKTVLNLKIKLVTRWETSDLSGRMLPLAFQLLV